MGTAQNIMLMVGSIIVVGGTIAMVAYMMMQRKRYGQYICEIFSRDGTGHIVRTFDKAGVFVDNKTKNKRFFLKKANVGLSPDKIPYIQGEDKSKKVFLLQTGLKNFHFIDFQIDNPSITLSVGEEDVNWAINAYERQKKLFQQSMLMQLLPYIALAFTSIIILVIFIYFFKDFATLKEMAIAMKEAAAEIAKYHTGTVITQGA